MCEAGQDVPLIHVYWMGMESDTRTLSNSGWDVRFKYNRYTNRTKLTIREPNSRVISAGECEGFPKNGALMVLEYMTTESNKRLKPPKVIENLSLSEGYLPALYAAILEIQEMRGRNRPKRSAAIIPMRGIDTSLKKYLEE